MRETLNQIFFIAFCLMTLPALVSCKEVTQPKDTQLVLQEISTKSKYNRRALENPEDILSWLRELRELEVGQLKNCDLIKYNNLESSLKARLWTAQAKSHSDKFSSINYVPVTQLQTLAGYFLLETPSLERLMQIGVAELESVKSDIRRFEVELKHKGFIGTLDELATNPKNFITDKNEVEKIYANLIFEAQSNLSSRFYSYEIPEAKIHIREASNQLTIPAKYSGGNAMIVYLNENGHNISRAAFISVHEIFPGHHLSIKASEKNRLCVGGNPQPLWFGEGWATYTEFVADQEGFFGAPNHKLAWFDYRLIRAMRIILDVKRMEGVRDRAGIKEIWNQYMPNRLDDQFEHELNRLIKSKHQHILYILGYNSILETKIKLKKNLGSKFDEKKFHDVMMREGLSTWPDTLYENMKVAMQMTADD